jgi:hypothetical protein
MSTLSTAPCDKVDSLVAHLRSQRTLKALIFGGAGHLGGSMSTLSPRLMRVEAFSPSFLLSFPTPFYSPPDFLSDKVDIRGAGK